jgi:hypothetical protein
VSVVTHRSHEIRFGIERPIALLVLRGGMPAYLTVEQAY